MKKKLVLRIILIVFISILIGYTLYGVSSNLSGNRAGLPFGFGMFVVESGSMEPELYVGDFIFVTRASRYIEGDTVVFQDGKSLVVHKIKTINGDEVITKGENNNTEDDPIHYGDIKGKVRFSIPKIGYVIDFIRSTPVTVALLAVAVFLYVYSLRRERQDENDKKDELQKEIEELKNSLNK